MTIFWSTKERNKTFLRSKLQMHFAKTMAMGIMYNNIIQERLNNSTFKYI